MLPTELISEYYDWELIDPGKTERHQATTKWIDPPETALWLYYVKVVARLGRKKTKMNQRIYNQLEHSLGIPASLPVSKRFALLPSFHM